jgi:ribosomal protein S12 methylthiotransferase accessory factor YcaO
MRDPWYLSRFTGLFRASGAAPRRAHDPAVSVWSGTPANRPVTGQIDGVGGAGWTDEAAQLAGVGEAIERWQTHQLPGDTVRRARACDLAGAVDPAAWVLFHAAQYAQPGFPFVALPAGAELDWVQLRRVSDGAPAWVPAELAFMDLRPGARHRFTPAISTGWSAHRSIPRGPLAPAPPAEPVRSPPPDSLRSSIQHAVLRGVQEVIERDALIGGWWGRYPVEALGFEAGAALARPNLRYRAYRIATPFSSHVTMVTVEGDDHEGACFAIGSACRETRATSLDKAALEAVQGRHYVRYLRAQLAARGVTRLPVPHDFAEHAVGYSLEPARLAATPLATARPGAASVPAGEPLRELVRRLGDAHPPLFRLMTPPALAQAGDDWVVVRVMIPGLQPMHGDHALPFLGGPLWGDRPLAAWADVPPHPFA